MDEVLTKPQKVRRLIALAILLFLAGYFYLMQMLGLPSAPPCTFRMMFGVPCLMCGGTRALYALLQGRWGDAFYFNPLVFFVAPFLVGLIIVLVVELLTSRDITSFAFSRVSSALFHPLVIPWVIVVLVSLWAWHVHTALTFPKPELLRPASWGAPHSGS